MLYVLGLLGWMISGYLVMVATITIHVFKAEAKGYAAFKYFGDHVEDVTEEVGEMFQKQESFLQLVWGLIVWPVRWTSLMDEFPKLYEEYELKH